MVTFTCALLILQAKSTAASRMDLGERVKRLDRLWVDQKDVLRRRQAVVSINGSVGSFFSAKWSEASRQLDEACAALRGEKISTSDAISLRFEPPVVEPKTKAKLRISWAYAPQEFRAVRIQVGGQSVSAIPGRTITIDVQPEVAVPELRAGGDAGVLVPITVDGSTRFTYLSVVKSYRPRLERLEKSTKPEVLGLVDVLTKLLDPDHEDETDPSFVQLLGTAEIMEAGDLSSINELFTCSYGSTKFRVALPKGNRKGPMTVVIAYHGAGASQNMFFESYGGGMVASEALKRGWIFVAPTVRAGAYEDILKWLRERAKINVSRIVLMGHSMGGGAVFSEANKMSPKPDALVAFAPAAGVIPEGLKSIPLFLAVGKQEMGMIQNNVQRMSKSMAGSPNFELFEADPCEHLMIVADAARPAFTFLDRVLSRR
jgi:predicted esterase